MYKNGTVTFSEWYKGQASHPVAGFGLLKNVEVFENKGIAKLKNAFTLDNGVTPTALPIARQADVDGNEYIAVGITGPSDVYKNGVSIGSFSFVHDIKIYKDYLFIRHGEFLAMYGPLSSGAAELFGGYSEFTTAYNAQLLVGQDDFLYMTNGNEVRKMEVTASGTVGVQPTVVIDTAILNLKDGQYATCLEELGTNIIVGTQGGGSYSKRGGSPEARLYPWNRLAGTLGNPGLADLPVIIDESGINAIKQHGNRLYVSAGTRGSIYVTDSVNYVKIANLPYTKEGINSQSTVYTNAMDFSASGTLLVGLSCEQDDRSRPGVYEIDIEQPENPVTFQTVSSTSGITGKIGFIDGITYNQTKVGWADGDTVGMDVTSSELEESFGGVIETPLVKVGRSKKKKTFQHIEWNTAEPLATGQAIRISYRKNTLEDYTLIKSWDFATYGAITEFEDVAAIETTNVQLKIELDDDGSASSNLYLISVSIW